MLDSVKFPSQKFAQFIFPLTVCHFPNFFKDHVLYFLVTPRELVPEPPWIPKSMDPQVLYIKWCIAVGSLYPRFCIHIFKNCSWNLNLRICQFRTHVGVSVVKFVWCERSEWSYYNVNIYVSSGTFAFLFLQNVFMYH